MGDSKKVSLDRSILFELFIPRPQFGIEETSKMNTILINRAVAWKSAVCLGFLGFVANIAQADPATDRPAKQLSEANSQINWPEGFAPKEADAFVHNEIFIKAPARVIWSNLVNAKKWPTWYSNAADVQITEDDGGRLGPKSQFTWKTFGFPVSSQIKEFVPNTRVAWFGDGTGIRAYHTWLIIEKGDGCDVVTEETQNGPAAIAFNLTQPKAMYDGHDWWLTALKIRSENNAK
jgi:Polyketide cyclase / dehydrase and lipid transport